MGLCANNYGGQDPVCPSIQESEATDRSTLLLPSSQLALYRKIESLNKPIVLFLINAGGLDVLEMKNSKNVVGIVYAGLGGQYGGRALVDVISGAYNPAAALTMTWYPQTYADMTQFHDMTMRGGTSSNPAGRTYRYLNRSMVEPVYEFGYGLSYTKFEVEFGKSDSTVVVRNVGMRSGDCVVTCYSVEEGIKTLVDFTRLENLEPGSMASLEMNGLMSRCEVTGGVYVQK